VDSIPKGSGLTNAELDSNFINLRDQTIAITGDTGTVDVAAGDTITFAGATVSGNTVTITGGGGEANQNAFSNIAVAGQSTVSADTTSDTFTLAAGSNVTLTTNAGTDTVTISASGSGTGDLIIANSEISTTNSAITLHPKSTSASGGTGNLNIGLNTATSVPDIVFRDIGNYDNDYHGGVGPSDYISTGGMANAITCSGDLLLGAGYSNQAGTEDATNNIVLDARLTRIYGNGTNAILTTAAGNDLILTVQEANDGTSDAYIGVNSGLIKINAGTNGDIEVVPHGSGKIVLDTENIYLGPVASGTLSFSGSFAANVGPQTLYRDTAPALNTGNIYPNARNAEIILNADVTTANRARITDALDLDLNGYGWGSTSGGAGPAHGKFITVINSEATTESLGTIKALDLGIAFPAGTNAGSTINTTSVYGARTLLQLSTGSNDTVNITNHYGYYYGSTYQSSNNGTTTLSNEYGFYVGNPIGAQVSANKYGFYAASDAYNNRLGGINLYNNTIQAMDTNDNLTISNNGSGYLQLNAVQFPAGDGTNGQVLATNGAGVLSWASGATSNVVEDVTPQLGGNLDVNGNSIVSVSNGDITLEPNGVGNVNVRADTLVLGDNSDINYIHGYSTGYSSADIQISPALVNTGIIRVRGLNEDIVIQPDGSGKIHLDNNYWPNADGTNGQTLSTNGSGVLSWVTPSADVAVDPITFVGDDSTGTAVNTGETFKFAGAQNITTAVSADTLTITGPDLSAYLTSVPAQTFASLTSKPTTIAGYGITDAFANVVEDVTPQLGGNLDINSKNIVSVSNGNIKILPNGTGRVIIGTDPADGSTGFYGNNSVYGAQMNYENTAWNAATGPQHTNPLARSTDWTLDASTTTEGRITMIDAVELDLNGYNWNFSTDYYSGPQHQKSLVLTNTSSSASNTLDNAVVNFNKAEFQGSGSNNSTITVNQVFGERIQTVASQDTGDTATIGTNYGLHYQSPSNFGSGTLNVTNEYGVYIDQTSTTASGNITGLYINQTSGDDAIRIPGTSTNGIYIDSNVPNNRIGGLQFQYNRIKFSDASTPSTVSTLAWLYGDNSGGTQELYVKDGAGNVTQLSPHNEQGEWEYFSRNTDTGKVVRINMEEMIRDLEQLTGKTYIKDE